MVRDAEQYGEKDKERKELIEARNEADTLAYSVEKSLNEHKVSGCVGVGVGVGVRGGGVKVPAWGMRAAATPAHKPVLEKWLR
jgi:hypothetical protein